MAEAKQKLTFDVAATRVDAHGSIATCKSATIRLDTDLAGNADAFNPAALLLAALAACMIKGIERVQPMLRFQVRARLASRYTAQPRDVTHERATDRALVRLLPGHRAGIPVFDRALAFACLTAAVACTGGESASRRVPSRADSVLLVYNAAAIARPMRAVLDSFSARNGIRYEQETAASLELARKVLELGGRPDVLALADPEIFSKLLMPAHATWYALFARNRIVLAYTPRSRFASEIDSASWPDVLQRRNVEVGRADPNTDPSGYRTLLVWQLAERYYRRPGLAQRLLESSPTRNVRPREADQVALLEAGEYDYIWTYQNLAENAGFRYVKLPDATDLGEPADSATYAFAETRVHGRQPGDTLVVQGRPILFGVTIPASSPHAELGGRFVAFLLSPDGRRILRAHHFDALRSPVLVGSSTPPAVAASAVLP